MVKDCRTCKPPERYPGCQDHCPVGIKRSKEAARKRDERNKRAREEAQTRSYIRDTLEKRRRK